MIKLFQFFKITIFLKIMGVSRARKKQLAAAREAAQRKKAITPPKSPRKVSGSQILAPVLVKPPKRFSPQKRFIEEDFDCHRPPHRRQKLSKQHPYELQAKQTASPLVEDKTKLDILEARYLAIIEYLSSKAGTMRKHVPKGVVDQIINKYDLGIEQRQFRNLVKRSLTGQSIQRKVGSGRQVKYGSPEMINWVKETIRKRKGLMTKMELANLFRQRFNCGSYSTVWKLLEKIGCLSSIRLTKPYLKESHKQRRLQWVKECLTRKNPFGESRDMLVHVDEKWFFTQRLRKRVLYFPGMQRPTLHVQNKRFIPKLMFIGAVANPKPQYSFDGNIGCYLVGRRSKKRGCSRYVPINMGTKEFIEFMTRKIIPSILRKGRKWVKRVVIQFDNAGGHGGGAGDISNTVKKLNEWVESNKEKLKKIMKKRDVPQFFFIPQPPKSPDLNVLDLGVWNSIQSSIREPAQLPQLEMPWKDRLLQEVERAWDEKCTGDKLGRIFETLTHVWQKIYETQGSNMFNIPHFRK